MFLKRKDVEKIRKNYPVGTKLELDQMDDCQAPPVGTKGVVKGVDDIGSIMVNWENGSNLSLICGIDNFHKI